MQANTKPTADDGALVSEEPAQMKINNQLVDYSTPVRTSAMATAHPSAPPRAARPRAAPSSRHP